MCEVPEVLLVPQCNTLAHPTSLARGSLGLQWSVGALDREELGRLESSSRQPGVLRDGGTTAPRSSASASFSLKLPVLGGALGVGAGKNSTPVKGSLSVTPHEDTRTAGSYLGKEGDSPCQVGSEGSNTLSIIVNHTTNLEPIIISV